MDVDLPPFEALQLARDRAGGQAALARICGRAQPTVWKWFQSLKQLPAEHVLPVEAATGVPCYLLRPDIYPRGLVVPLEAPLDEFAPVVPSNRRAAFDARDHHAGRPAQRFMGAPR
jgi:DNA-binding transcriptional regulator YdaS (Cro superfamily)